MPDSPRFHQPELPDYALRDSGGAEKLERFGALVLRRPDPQAFWRPALEPAAWSAADLSFERESDRGGRWIARAGAPAAARAERPSWEVRLLGGRFRIRPTPFKHVGLFPEQATNWSFLPALRRSLEVEGPAFLNLFGYSGVASVLAARAGFRVTHVDASKHAIEWTLENAELSGLPRESLRVLLEDALAFARRELRRGARYEVIYLDPPHYGRGPKGEKWQLETGLPLLIEALGGLLAPRGLVVLSTYAVGITALSLANLLEDLGPGLVEHGELCLRETSPRARLLPAGFCARLWRDLEPLDPAE